MGIFPACPGSDEYLLTEPLFDKVRIFRSGNIELEIKKNDTAFSSDRLPFVCLGGKRISRWFVSHNEWMREKVISFEESDSSGEKSVQKRPYSLTKDAPEFEVSSVRLVDSVMCSGGLNAFLFTVKNKGSVGSYLAQTALENRYNASMRILLEANQEKADTLFFSLYREGIHTLSFAGREYAVQVLDIFKDSGEAYFRTLETNALQTISSKQGQIISCGGGAVLKDENVDILKKNGVIVLLTATPETIFDRVKDHTHRPILNNDMSLRHVKELMEQREPRYQSVANVKVNVDSNDRILTCYNIINYLEKEGYIEIEINN